MPGVLGGIHRACSARLLEVRRDTLSISQDICVCIPKSFPYLWVR